MVTAPPSTAPAVTLLGALAQVPLFSTLDHRHLQQLQEVASRRIYQPDQVLMAEGDSGNTLQIVLDGEVRVSVGATDGQEVVLAILGPGSPIGEMALLDSGPRSATITALTVTPTVVLSRTDFLDLLRDTPAISLRLLQVQAQRLRAADALVMDAWFLDVTARVAKKLLELAQTGGVPAERGRGIAIQIAQEELASQIVSTRASVSKSLGQLQRAGTLAVRRYRITILQPAALGTVAGRVTPWTW